MRANHRIQPNAMRGPCHGHNPHAHAHSNLRLLPWRAAQEHTLNPAGLDEARVRFAASRPHFCSVDTTKLALDVTLQQRVERAFASATAEA